MWGLEEGGGPALNIPQDTAGDCGGRFPRRQPGPFLSGAGAWAPSGSAHVPRVAAARGLGSPCPVHGCALCMGVHGHRRTHLPPRFAESSLCRGEICQALSLPPCSAVPSGSHGCHCVVGGTAVRLLGAALGAPPLRPPASALGAASWVPPSRSGSVGCPVSWGSLSTGIPPPGNLSPSPPHCSLPPCPS